MLGRRGQGKEGALGLPHSLELLSQLLAPAGAWEEQLELLAACGWVWLWPGAASAVLGCRTTRTLVLLE